MNHQQVENSEEGVEPEKYTDKAIDDVKDDEEEPVDDDGDGPPSFEKVLECLGMPGRYQLIQLIYSKMSLTIVTYLLLSIVFVGYTPYHECKKVNDTELIKRYSSELNGNVSSAHVSYESCDIEIKITSNQSDNTQPTFHSLSCPEGRDFFSAEGTTYNSEWDLVCESKGQIEFTQTTFTIGQIVGGLGSSPIADRFGRKPVIVCSLFLCLLFEVGHVLSPSIFIVYIIRFFHGLAGQAALTTVTIYAVELVVPRHRQIVIAGYYTCWVFSTLVTGASAYFVRNMSWRYFHVASIGFGLMALLTPFILTESPRWLAANKRYEEALQILKKACEQNGKDFELVKRKFNAFIAHTYSHSNESIKPLVKDNNSIFGNSDKIDITDCTSREESISIHDDAPAKMGETVEKTYSSSPFTLMCHKKLLILMAVCWYLWLTIILTFYGIIMSSSVLAGNRFLNFILMSLVELPGVALNLYMLNKLGRLTVLRIFMGLTSLSLMVSALMSTVGKELPGAETINTVMFILGKLFITASFSTIYVITPELFPTNMRTTGTGYCSGVGRIGSMVAPFMRILHQEVKWGPALLFTTMCFVAVLVSFYLPETKNKDLPTTYEDVINQGKKDSVKSKERGHGKDVVTNKKANSLV